MRFRLCTHSAPNDPEKLVLPGVLYVRLDEGGRGLFFGWWHWSIAILWASQPLEEREG